MKRGDTKTLSKEGNNALTLVRLAVSSLFLTLLLSGFLHSQSKLNNFGISEVISTYKGYKNFSLIDYNNDGIEDLFLFGNRQKNFVIHNGIADSTFSRPIRKFFFFPIDDFKWLTKSERGEDYYIFVSRNKRLVGLVSFTKSNSLQLLHTIEYESYPSSIKIVDIDENGKNEALIYGDNFNGIELVENDGYRIKAKQIVDDMIVRGIDTVDINQDSNTDFVVVDLLHNSLKFLENIEDTVFTIRREINFEESITNVSCEYFNNDSMIDLLVTKESGLEILVGDSVLSFDERLTLEYPFSPNDFLLSNICNDSTNEIILINSLGDQLIVSSKNDSISQNLSYDFKGISAINLQDKFPFENLVLLSDNGKIKIISNENKWGKSFSFTASGSPNKISFARDASISMMVHDQSENLINFYSTDSLGNFNTFFGTSFTNLISDFKYSSNLDFYAGFYKNKRLIEIVNRKNVQNLNSDHTYLYSSYPIKSLNIASSANIIVMESYEDNLYEQEFEYTNEGYKVHSAVLIDSNIVNSYLLGEKIYYLSLNEDNLIFKNVFNGKKKVIQKIKFNADNNNVRLIGSSRASLEFSIVTILKTNKENKILLFDGVTNTEFGYGKDFVMNSDNDYLLYRSDEQKTLIVSKNSEGTKVQIFRFDFENKRIKMLKSIEAKGINDYLVNQFYGNTYLVYSESENNVITFRLLEL